MMKIEIGEWLEVRTKGQGKGQIRGVQGSDQTHEFV